MVEVDPMLLLAGGTTIVAVVGLMSFCNQGKKKDTNIKIAPNKKLKKPEPSSPPPTIPSSVPQKSASIPQKSSSSPQKIEAPVANKQPNQETPKVVRIETPKVEPTQVEETKVKKAVRLERQKAAKEAKKSVPDKSSKAFDDNQIVQLESKEQHTDDWAVVEVKKVKKSKPAETPVVQTSSASSTSAASVAPPTDFVTSQVTVDAKKVGNVIGPKGVTLKALQELTGTQINTPKGDRDGNASGTSSIAVSGTAEGVAKASAAINDLCVKGYSLLLEGEDFQESNIAVHPK